MVLLINPWNTLQWALSDTFCLELRTKFAKAQIRVVNEFPRSWHKKPLLMTSSTRGPDWPMSRVWFLRSLLWDRVYKGWTILFLTEEGCWAIIKKIPAQQKYRKKSCTVGQGKKIEQAFLLVGSCWTQ